MRITELEKSSANGLTRVSATVTWEDCLQPEKRVFIETEEAFGDDLSANPQAFLVGCLIPALHFGEHRLVIDSPLCPTLFEGLHRIMAQMQLWTQGQMKPLTIQAPAKALPAKRSMPRRAGMFLSGGIDSLATLRLNLLHYPQDHPGRIRDCLLVHGFDIGGVVARGMKYPVFERAKAAMAPVAQAAQTTMIPVYTNLRLQCDNRDLRMNRFLCAVLAGEAHAFTTRLDIVYLAASYDMANLVPCGSHPMIDPEFSSFDLSLRHRDVEYTRIEKLRLIADWDVALQHFRVCLANVPDRLNCGRCEKCVRTMTGLVAVGALHKTRAFVEDDVAPELFDNFSITIRHRQPFYLELLDDLEKVGRQDLAAIIRRKLAEPPPAAH